MSTIRKGSICAALAACALAPSVVAAVSTGAESNDSPSLDSFERFTPAGVDSALAEHFDLAKLDADGDFAFTPANADEQDRSVTIVVRAPGQAGKLIRANRGGEAGRLAGVTADKPVVLGATSYDLGAAKGIQSFTPTPSREQPKSREPRLVDLERGGDFRLDGGDAGRSSGIDRMDRRKGSEMARTTSGLTEGETDLTGQLKVLKGVAVTAGVRVDKEEARTPRLTDDERDNQAVYVGTLITF